MKKFIKAVGGVGHSVVYTDEDGRHFRFINGTWAWRNHNPGNVYPGKISKRHNQIGATHNFAIFPDDESGHASLLETLITTYGNYSIHDMIYSFAPPKDHNPTAYYEKLLRKATGIYDNKLIKNFTATEFENLWKGIQKMEEYVVGDIIEVSCITKVKKIGKEYYQFCLDDEKWIWHEDCIALAKAKAIELELCVSKYGKNYLRAPHNSQFQKPLQDLPCQKD